MPQRPASPRRSTRSLRTGRRAPSAGPPAAAPRRCSPAPRGSRRIPIQAVVKTSFSPLDDLCQGVGLRAWHEDVHDHCVTNDIDTLATALYVRTDDLLKQYPDLAPWRPKIGLQPQLTDAELVTLAVMQALLGYTSEARWIRHAHAHLGHLFPYLPGQPGYNRRLRAAPPLITP